MNEHVFRFEFVLHHFKFLRASAHCISRHLVILMIAACHLQVQWCLFASCSTTATNYELRRFNDDTPVHSRTSGILFLQILLKRYFCGGLHIVDVGLITKRELLKDLELLLLFQ